LGIVKIFISDDVPVNSAQQVVFTGIAAVKEGSKIPREDWKFLSMPKAILS
jgi:hypothetical protein